jgi:hypothetical protein
MARPLEVKIRKFAEEGRVTALGRCERVDPHGFFRGLSVIVMKMVRPSPSVQIPQMNLLYQAFMLQQWQGITEVIKQKFP